MIYALLGMAIVVLAGTSLKWQARWRWRIFAKQKGTPQQTAS